VYAWAETGIAELIIFKTTIRKIAKDIVADGGVLDSFYLQEYFLVLVMALLEAPLTLVSKIQKLKTMAFLGVSGIVAFMSSFVVFFLVASLDQDPANNPAGGMQMFPQKWFGAAATVPNVLLSVSYQLNFFPIFKGMKNVTDAKMGKASGLAIAFCTISYLLVGILGYQYVGNGVTANFLNSLSYEKISPAFFFIINISFLLSIFFAFPIMFFSCRNNFIAIVKLFVAPKEQDKSRSWRAGD
jgi:amino acid permease